MLLGKKVLVGITGGIAAYKSVLFVRELVKAGAEVQIILTPAAHHFVSPLTLSTLSKNPVYTKFVKNELGEWTNHVELGNWGDLFIIAPCTANTLSKMAHGTCDNLLLATYLSAKCPVLVAPAMDLDMYSHESTQSNIAAIKNFGVKVIDAVHGELASGLVGKGRMAEPEDLLDEASQFFDNRGKGLKVLVTAGPTVEAIDPVRYISNHSSGKMGYLIAEELSAKGFDVTLVSGPTHIDKPNVSMLIEVNSAKEMLEACLSVFDSMNIAVMAAAVADYTPSHYAEEKIKKEDSPSEIALTKTVDIAKALGKRKRKDQYLVGFALETDNGILNAQKKLSSKNFDMIVLNTLKDEGAGFGHDTNKITIFDKDNNQLNFELKSKREVAKDIVKEIIVRHS